MEPSNENAQDTNNAPEVMPSMEEMLKVAELKAQEHYDAWMYSKAEGENIRRRALEDVSKAQKFAVERFANEMSAPSCCNFVYALRTSSTRRGGNGVSIIHCRICLPVAASAVTSFTARFSSAACMR